MPDNRTPQSEPSRGDSGRAEMAGRYWPTARALRLLNIDVPNTVADDEPVLVVADVVHAEAVRP